MDNSCTDVCHGVLTLLNTVKLLRMTHPTSKLDLLALELRMTIKLGALMVVAVAVVAAIVKL